VAVEDTGKVKEQAGQIEKLEASENELKSQL